LKMKFSIIIPVHNEQDKLKPCLDAIFSSETKDFEVIVVDDKSTDKSVEIAEMYPCKLITLGENKRAAYARNIGRANSEGDIFVFIDADVIIKKDTLDVIWQSFKENNDIAAVTGILSKDCPYKNFFSQYKNLYMNYVFRKCPKYIDFLYGSIIAIKKEHYLPFNEGFKITDDTELGQRYKELNKKILLNPSLEVIHSKRYNFKTIIKNDFFVPFWWSKSFILHRGYWDIFRKKRFAHARVSQIISVLVSCFLLISLFFQWNPIARHIFLSLLFLFILLSYNFFLFLYKEKGFLFLLKSIIFTYLDMLVMGLGILTGFIDCLVKGFCKRSKRLFKTSIQ